MIAAGILLVLGFFSVAYVTQTRGLRLGGTIVVPVLALYTLKNFVALPVFAVSFALAYTALWLAKGYTLVYGRKEFTVAILAGSLLPLGLLFLGEFVGLGAVADLRAALFLGSLLPGLAAFNVQQMKPEYRRQDVLVSVGLYVLLLVVGALLVDPRLAPVLGTRTPLVLYAATSDIAVLRGAVVDGTLYPVLLDRTLAVGLLMLAFLVSEGARSRFGVRAGVVSMGLLALYATASGWLVVLFLVDLAVVVFVIAVAHTTALWYGRMLIGVGAGVSVLVTLGLVTVLPVVRGLSALFVAVLAGVTAYNHHVTAPHERRLRIPLALLVFAPLFLLARLLGRPYERGLFADLPTMPWVLLLALVVTGASLLYLRRATVAQPSDEAVLSASVLSGGDG